jgi:uncharacterized protein DUF2460
MSGFHEVRFPDNIAYGATGGPEFATTVVVTGAGHEQRNIDWAEARGRWDVASGLKTQAQLDELIAFFRARKGKAYGFRFKDWTRLQGHRPADRHGRWRHQDLPAGQALSFGQRGRGAHDHEAGLGHGARLQRWCGAARGLLGRRDVRHHHLHRCAGHGRGNDCRFRARRAGSLRHRPHGRDHRELQTPPLQQIPIVELRS